MMFLFLFCCSLEPGREADGGLFALLLPGSGAGDNSRERLCEFTSLD